MTRADFMANICIPKSTPSKIIIPSNSSGNGFMSNCYRSAYLDKLISKQEFDDIVE